MVSPGLLSYSATSKKTTITANLQANRVLDQYIKWFDFDPNRLDSCFLLSDWAPPETTPVTSTSTKRDLGFWCPLQLKTKPGLGSSFLGAQDCAPPCSNMYFKPGDIIFAKSFVGVCSIICLGATLFTFLTFLIDVKRFRYPERPIIFYAVCYSFVSLMYFFGFLLGNNAACTKATHPSGVDTVVLGSQSKGCTLLFMLLYFFSIAGIVWWVILTITWFLAAGPKWSCEAIEKKAVQILKAYDKYINSSINIDLCVLFL